MHLAPQHFQAQRRYHEESLARALDALFPFAWGVVAVELDGDALRNGTLRLVHARGVLPDGTAVHVPDADRLPAPLPLAERFAPTREAHVVHLALAGWRGDGANVAGIEGGDADDAGRGGHEPAASPGAAPANGARAREGDPGEGHARFVSVARVVADETTGDDARPVRFAARNLRLLLDDAVTPDDVTLPLARVRRDGAGHFVFDPAFVPPALQLGASPALVALVQSVVEQLDAKGRALAATLAPARPAAAGAPAVGGGGAAAYGGHEVATRWLLHALRSAEAPLRHLLATRRAHPERLWLELARLAGALCTFSLTTQPRDLPAYAHEDLGGCFGALARHLRAHLDLVIAPRVLTLPLQPRAMALQPAVTPGATPPGEVARTLVLHVGALSDARCFEPGARWFLGVRSRGDLAQTTALVPQFAKVCAARYVPELVRRMIAGLALVHVPAPPAALAPRPGTTYFEIALAEPCAGLMRAAQDVGVYVPDSVPEAALELAVLLPG